MSFLSYPPPALHSNRRTTVTPPQTNRSTAEVEPDSRLAMAAARTPATAFPFPADARNFTPKIPDLASALYGLPYGGSHAAVSPMYGGIPPGIDHAAFYAALSRMDPKDIPSNWRAMHPPHQLGPFDPSLTSLLYQGGYSPLLMGDRIPPRKNATRETTATLKAWLNEHRKNPYPTKGEKIMLALVSKMSLTQVSTWFANARRRLKKENKMTWSPRNRCSEDRDSDDEGRERGIPISPRHHFDDMNSRRSSPLKDDDASQSELDRFDGSGIPFHQYQQQMLLRQLATLSPHLRTPEAIKHYQEQMQLRSRWGAVRNPDPSTPMSLANPDQPRSVAASHIVSPTMATLSGIQQRKSSLTSFERSPSPLHRTTSTSRSLSLSDQPTLKNTNGINEERKGASKSSESLQSAKPAIWSPISMSGDKHTASKPIPSPVSASLAQRQSSPSSFIPTVTSSISGDRLSIDSNESASSSRHNNSDKLNIALSPPTVSLEKHWINNIAAQHTLSNHQQMLAATLAASFAGGKNGSSPHPNLLEHLQRHYPYRSQFLVPEHTAEKSQNEDRKSSLSLQGDEEEALSDQDISAPINLSKHTRQENGDVTMINLKMETKTRAPSVAAN